MVIPPVVLGEFVPKGRLRAAINLGNSVLVQKMPDGKLAGVTVDFAIELARRANVSLELVPFEAAGEVFKALGHDKWDMAFLAVEPARAAEIDFTAPYLAIEGAYMVRETSSLRDVEEVDRAGVRIAVRQGSAYDLYLSRTLKSAQIVRAETGGGAAMIDLFNAEALDVVAGVRQVLETYAGKHPGYRILTRPFMTIYQAIGVPKGRPAAASYLQLFVEEVTHSGFVEQALSRSGQVATVCRNKSA